MGVTAHIIPPSGQDPLRGLESASMLSPTHAPSHPMQQHVIAQPDFLTCLVHTTFRVPTLARCTNQSSKIEALLRTKAQGRNRARSLSACCEARHRPLFLEPRHGPPCHYGLAQCTHPALPPILTPPTTPWLSADLSAVPSFCTAFSSVQPSATQNFRTGPNPPVAKSGMKSGLCFPKGEPRTTKKVNHPNT